MQNRGREQETHGQIPKSTRIEEATQLVGHTDHEKGLLEDNGLGSGGPGSDLLRRLRRPPGDGDGTGEGQTGTGCQRRPLLFRKLWDLAAALQRCIEYLPVRRAKYLL